MFPFVEKNEFNETGLIPPVKVVPTGPAIILFTNFKVPAVALPTAREPSINTMLDLKSIKIELYTFNCVALLKRNALSCPTANVVVGAKVARKDGPTEVIFVNIAEVVSKPVPEAVPAALLSDSKLSEVETDGLSAIDGSLTINPYCTKPLKPLSVSKSSSRFL